MMPQIQDPGRRSCTLGPLALLAVCAFATCLGITGSSRTLVGLNQEIQYDDFGFTVVEVRRATTLEGEAKSAATQAHGVFWIVTMKVANHAKRVPFTFNKHAVILEDGAGNEFRPSQVGQAAFDAARAGTDPCASPLPAGTSGATEIVFDVPENVDGILLRISEGGRLGDVLDNIFYGKKRIQLQ